MNGLAGVAGVAGRSGVNGLAGVAGLAGVNGLAGLAGLAGVNGLTGLGGAGTLGGRLLPGPEPLLLARRGERLGVPRDAPFGPVLVPAAIAHAPIVPGGTVSHRTEPERTPG
ncbi:hypothetical protein GCM10022199_13100 [Marihabitans asiaticum]|uniref:Collagen triple helix repeat protein n=1 Tax=Marihabitans asiaticum TaxID=415218 RepID=A0A560WI05_9MICO|nr:hypothetical protein FB557_0889 [Marihabitans asiaticum]